jgi:WD40 repeat protein
MEKLHLNTGPDAVPPSPKFFSNGSYSLEDFPNEIWAVILLYLAPNDLLAASATAKRLMLLSELAWKAKCYARYKKLPQSDFARLLRQMNTKVFASGMSMQMDLEHRKTKTKSKKRSGSLLSGSPPTAQSSPLSSSPSKRKSSATLKVDNSSNKSPHVKSNNNTTSNTNNNSSSDSDEDMKQYGAFGWKHLYFNKSQVENLGWLANKLEPAKTLNFHERGRVVEPGGIHSYHLFPSCVLVDENEIITGSAAWEMINDPSTMMVGNRLIKVWDFNTGKLLYQLDGHYEAVLDMDWNEDLLVSCSRDRLVNVWDRKARSLVHTFQGHEKAVYRLQLHHNLIVSCSKDQTVRIWDMKTNTCAHVLKEHKKEVRCVRMNDEIIVSGSEDDTIVKVDAITMQKIQTINLKKTVACLQMKDNVMWAACDKSLHQIDIRTGDVVRSIKRDHKNKKFSAYIRQIQFDDNKIVFALGSGNIIVADQNSARCLRKLPVAPHHRVCFQFTDRDHLVTGDSNKQIKIYDFGVERLSETEVSNKKCSVM